MRALSLDFQANASAPRAGYALAVCGGLAVVLSMAAQSMLSGKIAHVRDALAATQAERDVTALPNGVESEAAALEGARAIVERLANPWDALFAELEAIPAPNVALLALTPDAQKRQVRIYAEARNLTSMAAYYRALQQRARLRDVTLIEHEVQSGDPQQPVRFALTAGWGDS